MRMTIAAMPMMKEPMRRRLIECKRKGRLVAKKCIAVIVKHSVVI